MRNAMRADEFDSDGKPTPATLARWYCSFVLTRSLPRAAGVAKRARGAPSSVGVKDEMYALVAELRRIADVTERVAWDIEVPR